MEIATKERNKAIIVSSVMLSGAKSALVFLIKANKDHYALALEEFQEQDFENILKRTSFCGIPGHRKKEMEFFCKICEVAICNSCALLDHEGHAKMPLELAANERKLRLKSAIESQKKRAEAKKSQIEKLNEYYNEVLEQAACVRETYLSMLTAFMQLLKLRN